MPSYPIQGPWKGIEERETHQTDQHCSLAVNVTFERGYIEGRDGFERVNDDGIGWPLPLGTAGYPNIAVLEDHRTGQRYIIAAGPSEHHGNAPAVDIYDGDGVFIANTNLRTAFGEPSLPDWQCQMVPMSFGFSSDKVVHDFMAIITPFNSYFVDTQNVAAGAQVISQQTHTRKDLQDKPTYWNVNPRAVTAIMSRSRLFFAVAESQVIRISDDIPDDNIDLFPEQNIEGRISGGSERSDIRINPNEVWFSNWTDPFAIGAHQNILIPVGERIMSLKEFGGRVFIFSDRNIYVLQGTVDDVENVSEAAKVVDGVGTVGPNCVQEAGGMLIFMSHDGVYGFDGQGAQKLSDPIDSLWSNQLSSTSSNLRDADLTALGYPFKIAKDDLRFTGSVHISAKSQVLFSVPLLGGRMRDTPLILVFDYAHGAWSFYINREKRTLMYNGTTYRDNRGKEVVLTSGEGLTTGGLHSYAWIFKHARPGVDDSLPFDEIPVFWLSARHLKDNEEVYSFRRLRFCMLARGITPGGSIGPQYYLEGEEAPFDTRLEGGAANNTDRQQATGDITMHPRNDSFDFLGTGELDSMKLGPVGWFTSRMDPSPVASKSFKVGFKDLALDGSYKLPTMVLQSYSIEGPDVSRGLR